MSNEAAALYAIQPVEIDFTTGQRSGGHLVWYRHDGLAHGTFAWVGPKTVGNGWDKFKQVFSGGFGVVYAVNENGELMWYHHDGQADGRFTWQGPKQVGHGWNFDRVFSGGYGVIYAIEPVEIDFTTGQRSGGNLLWYRHNGWGKGTFAWDGPKTVGRGWDKFKQVFSGGDGVLYAVKDNGDLMWYRHEGRNDGTFRWQGPKQVGHGWNFDQIFSGGDGVIYATQPVEVDERSGQRSGGNLLWYRHDGWAQGTFAWDGPKTVGTGWGNFTDVFAARIPPPLAKFTPTPATGVAPLSVTFVNHSSGAITSSQWTIDGVALQSSAALTSPTHVFLHAGPGAASLTLSGPGGTSTATASLTIKAPTSGPQPEPGGYDELLIQNCHAAHRPLHIYYRGLGDSDLAWAPINDSPHAADYNAAGTCPAGPSVGARFAMDDGVVYEVVCTDPQLPGCMSGGPAEPACRRSSVFVVRGKTGGGTKTVIVNGRRPG